MNASVKLDLNMTHSEASTLNSSYSYTLYSASFLLFMSKSLLLSFSLILHITVHVLMSL